MSSQLQIVQATMLDGVLNGAKIRVDANTKQVSVIDVAVSITGYNKHDCAQTVRALTISNHELGKRVSRLRINNKGKLTSVCDVTTAIEFIKSLPGQAAREVRNYLLDRGQRAENAWESLVRDGVATRTENEVNIKIVTQTVELTALDDPTLKTTEELLSQFLAMPAEILDQISREKRPRMSSVYFIGAEETPFVKVGVSHNPIKRLDHLQIGCPYALTLLRTIEAGFMGYLAESMLHQRFTQQGKHIRGEWFELTPDEVNNICLKRPRD